MTVEAADTYPLEHIGHRFTHVAGHIAYHHKIWCLRIVSSVGSIPMIMYWNLKGNSSAIFIHVLVSDYNYRADAPNLLSQILGQITEEKSRTHSNFQLMIYDHVPLFEPKMLHRWLTKIGTVPFVFWSISATTFLTSSKISRTKYAILKCLTHSLFSYFYH